MTLIVTALADDAVLQVSDRRLTVTTGTTVDIYAEDAVKAICVACADARFVIGYTGLAKFSGRRTDRWIVDELTDMRAGNLSLQSLIETFRARAGSAFGALKHLGSGRGISFILAGFGHMGPFAAMLSNMEDEHWKPLRQIDDGFRVVVMLRNATILRGVDLVIHGAEAAVDAALTRAIPKLRKRCLRVAPERRATMLAQFVRVAASTRVNGRHVGKYIGKDCQSVIVGPDGGFVAEYHPERESPKKFAPHLVTADLSMIDAWSMAVEPEHTAEEPPWLRGVVALSQRVTSEGNGTVPALYLDYKLHGFGLFAEARGKQWGDSSPCVLTFGRGSPGLEPARADPRYPIVVDDPADAGRPPPESWLCALGAWLRDAGCPGAEVDVFVPSLGGLTRGDIAFRLSEYFRSSG